MHTERRHHRPFLCALPRLLALALLLVCQPVWGSARAETGGSPMAIVTPPDRAVLEGELANVTLRLQPGSVDEIRISVNDWRVRLPKRKYQQHSACFGGIELSYGLNDIKVVGLKEGKQVGELHARVFRRSDLAVVANSAPSGFKRFLFHDPAQEKGCSPCHQLDFSGFEAAETKTELSPCFQCHKQLLSNYRTVHGPAAVWSCLSCHDPKGSPKLAVQKPESKVCNECHENSWMSMKFSHGPTAAGGCATCHDPHASNHPYFLRTPERELCTGCHEEVLRKPHVIIGFSNQGHPVRKFPDPYNPGREFTCISCHNPHAGSSWTFLKNWDGTSGITNFCITCHIM